MSPYVKKTVMQLLLHTLFEKCKGKLSNAKHSGELCMHNWSHGQTGPTGTLKHCKNILLNMQIHGPSYKVTIK